MRFGVSRYFGVQISVWTPRDMQPRTQLTPFFGGLTGTMGQIFQNMCHLGSRCNNNSN